MTGMNLNKSLLVHRGSTPMWNKMMEVSFSNRILFQMRKSHLLVKDLNKLLKASMIIIKKKNSKKRNFKKRKPKRKKNYLLMPRDFVNALIKDAIKTLKKRKIMTRLVIIIPVNLFFMILKNFGLVAKQNPMIGMILWNCQLVLLENISLNMFDFVLMYKIFEK